LILSNILSVIKIDHEAFEKLIGLYCFDQKRKILYCL